uniref:Small ribosomal subunit protein uS8c n=1 Tax=Verdigellas peltata TaxID=542676 RepID=A0A161KK65_9VIRI|nr:ribosomal protein S8 [Verdigellas peltata]CZF96635.1 ribosomal protein S8 [Verdigellas peltata]
MITDPIADILTRIRNSIARKHPFVILPLTKYAKIFAKILLDEGYILTVDEQFNENKKILILFLKYKYENKQKVSIFTSLKRISRPGLRVYINHKNIPYVLGGMGIAIISTSQGIFSDRKARQLNLGGELLCTIW